MPLFNKGKKSKGKDGKKKKTKTTTTDTTNKKKKKGKSKHGKHKKGSKGTKDSHEKRRHREKGDGEKKRKKKPRIPQLPPCEGEDLGNVVLVKDKNKRSNEAIYPSKEWKPPAAASVEYRSMEPVETKAEPTKDQIPAILGGHKKTHPEKKSPTKAAGDGGERRSEERPRRQKKISTAPAKVEPKVEAKVEAPPENKVDDNKAIVIEDDKKAKGDLIVPATSSPPKDNISHQKEGIQSDKDVTKKELKEKKEEKPKSKENDLSKWRSYAEKVLDEGMPGISKCFRRLRGYLPTAATRTAFDAHSQDNRFEDIVCVDHSRVEIKDNDAYIHANWVEVDKTKKLILTQLPLPHTASRFWQMILETDAQAILLLLTSYEYDTFHGEATFPEQQDFLHFKDRHIRVGDFKRIKVANGWTLRILAVTNGYKKKYLHLHHYSNWYHGQDLKNYKDLMSIESVFKRYKGPDVVISLSGCGRAGTYAAYQVAHRRLHDNSVEKLDVEIAVQRVRDGRMHAVQRASQLKTVHMALLDHVLNNGFIKDISQKQKATWEELQKPVDE